MRGTRGITLIEFIIMTAVGSFLVSGLVLFARQETLNATTMRDLLIASNLARLKMAQMNNTAYASLPVGTLTLPGESSFPGFDIQRAISTAASSGGTSLRQIEIRIDYAGGSFTSPLVRLITYRESSVTFGDGI